MPPKRQKKKSPPKASTTEEAVSGNDASGDVSRSNIITGARTRKGAETTSDRNNSQTDRETDGEHITAGRKKSPEVVLKKTRPRAQNNSGKSPKRSKGDPQSGTGGAAETTSDRNNSQTDRETDGEHITAGRKKSPDVVPKKTRPRAQINSGKSPKRGKADPQSGTDGAAETTSDHNNSLTDRDTDSEHITAGRNDDDAIKGCGDHGRGRFRLPPPPLAA